MTINETRYQLDRATLSELLSDHPNYRIEQLWKGMYEDGLDISDISTLPKALRADLAAILPLALSNRTERIRAARRTSGCGV